MSARSPMRFPPLPLPSSTRRATRSCASMPHCVSLSATTAEVCVFPQAHLGMGVQIAADRGEFVGKVLDAVDGGHVVIRCP